VVIVCVIFLWINHLHRNKKSMALLFPASGDFSGELPEKSPQKKFIFLF